ncbi:MAG: trypsin-like peptidase domain-containing protein [Lachnospiraceae bacterium]|nr:trypsin-like peptidase domain-containing protein [Lachnospiraceae bacterium]
MWEEKGYIYVIYDFADYNRVDPILADFAGMGLHVADCSGNYDTSFETENEEELIEGCKVALLFITKQTGISHRLIGQLDQARRNNKRIITIFLDTLREITIPEDIMNFIQGQPKVKAYDYESYAGFLHGTKTMIKNYIQKSETNKGLEYGLRAGAVAMVLVLAFVGGKLLHARNIVDTLKDAAVKVLAIREDGSREVYNGTFIEKEGIILTDAQVADSKEVWIENGTEELGYLAEIVFSQMDKGIAVLSVDAECKEYIPYTNARIQDEEKVYTVTYVEGKTEPAVYDGELCKEEESQYRIVITGNVTFPYSGSPIMDRHGEIIGILCYENADKTEGVFYDLKPLQTLLESTASEKEGNDLPE